MRVEHGMDRADAPVMSGRMVGGETVPEVDAETVVVDLDLDIGGTPDMPGMEPGPEQM